MSTTKYIVYRLENADYATESVYQVCDTKYEATKLVIDMQYKEPFWIWYWQSKDLVAN